MQYVEFILIFLGSVLGTHGIQTYFIKKNKIDAIKGRSSHEATATRTGGITLFLSTLLITSWLYFHERELFDFSLLIPLSIMFLVGVYDDFYQADFKIKLLMQLIVAKIIIDQGLVIDNYYGFLGLHEIPWLLAQLTTLFVFVVVVNAINFIDGIDGLTITEFFKFIFLFEYFSSSTNPFRYLDTVLIISIIPLYYYNFRKEKKVFLGDGGSLFLGTLICIHTFYLLGDEYIFAKNLMLNKFIFSILILIYPLIDLLRIFVLRIRKGVSPFLPDKNHLHHIVLKKVDSHFKTNLSIQLINLIIWLCVIFTI